jgi:tetratricopeptide (TPR) repeat protein
MRCARHRARRRGAQAEEAIRDLNAAIDADAKNAHARYFRGVFLRERDKREALNDLSLCVQLCPTHARAYLARATLFERMGALPRAIADYDASFELDASTAKPRQRKAVCLAKVEMPKGAYLAVIEAIKADPTCAPLASAAVRGRPGSPEINLVEPRTTQTGTRTRPPQGGTEPVPSLPLGCTRLYCTGLPSPHLRAASGASPAGTCRRTRRAHGSRARRGRTRRRSARSRARSPCSRRAPRCTARAAGCC